MPRPTESPAAAGKTVRLGRILGPDGRTLIVALDHGVSGIGDLGALARPADLIAEVATAGADCLLVTPGIARAFAAAIDRLGVIVRIDGGPTAATGRWGRLRQLIAVEDALRLGADGVAMMGLVGVPGEEKSLARLAGVAADCERLGVPLLAEMLPGGLDAPDVTVDQLAIAARLAAELGADLVKVGYRGPAREFRAVTASCYRPVVVLGGAKQPVDDLARDVGAAMLAGAAGAAVGRNIWRDPRPGAVTARLREVVHHGPPRVEEAVA